MKNRKYWLLTCAVTLLPMLAGLLVWNRLPDKMPIHFGVDGAADGWGSKGFAVFGVPAMWLAFQLITWGATRLDKQNRGHNEKVMNLIGLIFPAMSLIFAAFMFGKVLDVEVDLGALLFVLLGLFFILVGNWLPKIKQNSTLGIKTKWTIYNEENWNKTHRFGGWCWVLGGAVFCVAGFLPVVGQLWLIPGLIILLAMAPMVYSWQLSRRQKREGTWTQSQLSRNLKKHPLVLAVSLVLVTVILLLVMVLMFSGDIDYNCTDTALVIRADWSRDSAVAYAEIDAIEYRDTAPSGTRQWGFASARLMMGSFDNKEFGGHIRYSYVGTDAYIVLHCGEDVLILNAENEQATHALYEELRAKLAE